MGNAEQAGCAVGGDCEDEGMIPYYEKGQFVGLVYCSEKCRTIAALMGDYVGETIPLDAKEYPSGDFVCCGQWCYTQKRKRKQ